MFFVTAIVIAGNNLVMGQTRPATTPAEATRPTTGPDRPETAREAAPRQIVEQTVPLVTNLLLNRSLTPAQKADCLQEIVNPRMDFPTLSRIMLGQAWDGLPQEQRGAFIDVFVDYLMGVYVPLMNEYNGQQVRVTEDSDVGRGDHLVTMRVTDLKGGSERQVALITCRLRQGEQGWKVIDVIIEGVSVARVFGSQFKPVLARDGMDCLIKQLRDKIAHSKPVNESRR